MGLLLEKEAPKMSIMSATSCLLRFSVASKREGSPISRLSPVKTTTYEVYIHKEAHFFHTCTCGSTDFIKSGINTSGNQRFKCTSCISSRVLSIHVFNLELAFDVLYEKKFTQSCMRLTKHQKRDAFKTDKKTITFFVSPMLNTPIQH